MINKAFRRSLLEARISSAIAMIDELVKGEPEWLATLGMTGIDGRVEMFGMLRHDVALYEEELRFLDRQ